MIYGKGSNIDNLVNKINTFCLRHKLSCNELFREEISYYEVIEVLVNIAVEMEKWIQQEHKKTFVTDDVERYFMLFACECMAYILNERKQNKRFRALAGKLFVHRHYGYAFFIIIDEEYSSDTQGTDYNLSNKQEDELLEKYGNIYKTAYMSMAEFYNQFFGRFSDNENATGIGRNGYS